MKTIMSITFALLALFALACFALVPQAWATCQEGCDSDFNTYLGEDALIHNTGGLTNTAIGGHALFNNTTASANTATGYNALYSNTAGAANTATGYNALKSSTTGDTNTAYGYNALRDMTTGDSNTAIGAHALIFHINGSGNVAIGDSALADNYNGSNNIAIGVAAGRALTNGSNNIDIGAFGVAGESNTIRIGSVTRLATATYIQGISGATLGRGVPVLVATGGRLGTLTSSARYKEEIKPMNKASEAILALQPVTFRYKKEFDPEGIPQFGLIAEDVAKVNPDLVIRDGDGKVNTVRYEAVNAMLLNEFLKEHRKNEEQQAIIAQLKSTVEKQEAANAKQQKQIESLTAGLQKVSAQLELSRLAPQTVKNTD